jgi:hypothetical protein
MRYLDFGDREHRLHGEKRRPDLEATFRKRNARQPTGPIFKDDSALGGYRGPQSLGDRQARSNASRRKTAAKPSMPSLETLNKLLTED